MKQYYELNKKDIEAIIIAEHFKCSPPDVVLSVKAVPVGYGTGERTEHIVTAIVASNPE